jgi:DNA adenine methylase
MTDLRAPYPWFGGKMAVSQTVWSMFGSVRNYVEPFFGSGAVLLQRPQPFNGTESVNDLNGWLCNFWRALQADPESVAIYADWPVSELDLHARGDWLFYRNGVAEFIERLRAEPDFYCAKSAGWWVWGQCCWIGTGWGPRQLPHLGDAGRGVNRQLPHLGNAGMGVNRQLPHLGDAGRGEPQTAKCEHLREYLRGLAERMRSVRVCCGDWSRVCGPTPTVKQGLTAVFLDPPYAVEDRADCYDENEDRSVSNAVREWAIEWGTDKRMRIALCGYEGEHDMPDSWKVFEWKARGGYGSQSADGNDNPHRERIWFSPHCLKISRPSQDDLFAELVLDESSI